MVVVSRHKVGTSLPVEQAKIFALPQNTSRCGALERAILLWALPLCGTRKARPFWAGPSLKWNAEVRPFWAVAKSRSLKYPTKISLSDYTFVVAPEQAASLIVRQRLFRHPPNFCSTAKIWWTRLQPIRTAAEINAKIVIEPDLRIPIYQRLSSKVKKLHALGISFRTIGKNLGVDLKTAIRAYRCSS